MVLTKKDNMFIKQAVFELLAKIERSIWNVLHVVRLQLFPRRIYLQFEFYYIWIIYSLLYPGSYTEFTMWIYKSCAALDV